MKRKGIILAGGSGTRLYPATKVISKQLLPVYDKPMIYYPLSVLMLAGIREILIISSPMQISLFEKLLGDGSCWGIKLQYAVQNSPDGIAQAFIIAEDFLDGAPSALILGDNIFYGQLIQDKIQMAANRANQATLFVHRVEDPERYGVAEISKNFEIISLEEKPKSPKSEFAVTGLYIFDKNASHYAKFVKRSKRGEFEITDLINAYVEERNIFVEPLSPGDAWLDMGTHESFLEAQQIVHAIQKRHGTKISCPEEIAFKKGWITDADLFALAKPILNNSYGQYLLKLAKGMDSAHK